VGQMNETLRNVALVAHGGAGKTSLAEIMINKAGLTTRVGRVEDGNTVMDFEPEELKRQASISSGFFQLPWKKHTISLIDTPGDQNFISDAKLCMQAADTALILVDAVDGVKVQTEQVADFASDI
jgi:elongation factor G